MYLSTLLINRINNYDRKTRKDNDKTWLNTHPIEKLNYKCRSFRQVAPNIWNKLPIIIRESTSIEIFKIKLKTFYFEQWLKQC